MSINTDFNLHRDILNGLLRIDMHDKMKLAAFRNIINIEIARMEAELRMISENNIFAVRRKLRINLLRTVEKWLEHKLLSVSSVL